LRHTYVDICGARDLKGSLTTAANNPQTLTTVWTPAVTSLTLQASNGDQVFDDLHLTTN
jgi:hypothetical protein